MTTIEAGSVSLIICDLPYGMTRLCWDRQIPLAEFWDEALRLIKPNGIVILFGSNRFAGTIITSNDRMYRYSLTWLKNNKTNHANAKHQPLRRTEAIHVFYRTKSETGLKPTF